MNENFEAIKSKINLQTKIIQEFSKILDWIKKNPEKVDDVFIRKQLKSLENKLKENGGALSEDLRTLTLARKLTPEEKPISPEVPVEAVKFFIKDKKLSEIEEITLKRIKSKKKKEEVILKEEKASEYLNLSNRFFQKYAIKLVKEDFFAPLKRDLIKTNLQILPSSYIAMILFTTTLATAISIFLIIFFLLFNFGVQFPFITPSQEEIAIRFLKTFWMVIVFPLATFFVMYIYPSTEKRYLEKIIHQELPFATINMAAISSSLIDPTRIFSILINTGDYPEIGKQFSKIINLVKFNGASLVSAVRTVSFNSPSSKLSELLNGISTTITSGGDLPDFFEKRADTLLLEYKLDREKYTKMAETFMDIYISVVIAAPMILMLLLIMMRISGLGISLGTGMITIIMVLGVTMINIAFLTFLHLKGGVEA